MDRMSEGISDQMSDLVSMTEIVSTPSLSLSLSRRGDDETDRQGQGGVVGVLISFFRRL